MISSFSHIPLSNQDEPYRAAQDIDNARREVQQLEVKNARLRKGNSDAAVVEDYRSKVEQLTREVNNLRIRLHEAQENEAKATDVAEEEKRSESNKKATTADVICLTEKCQQAEQEHDQWIKELEELQIIRTNEAEDLIQRCQGAEKKNEPLERRLEQAELSFYRCLEAARSARSGRSEK